MTINEIKRYITAGNACFTLESTKMNLRYTYKIKQDKANKDRYLCKVLYGPDNTSDYRFLGWFYKDKMSLQSNCPAVMSSSNHRFNMLHEFLFLLNTTKKLPETCKFYPSGKCARCGRKLTTPESIKYGLGPGCLRALIEQHLIKRNEMKERQIYKPIKRKETKDQACEKTPEKIFNEVIAKVKERFEQTKGYTTCYDVIIALTELAKQYSVEIKE